MTGSGAELVAAAQRYHRDPTGLPAVVAAFRRTSVALQRAAEPGVVLLRSTPWGPWLCVWTSLDRLWQALGRCHYAITTGDDIATTMIPLLPTATGVIVDSGSRHMVPLPRSILLSSSPPHPATPGARP